MVESGVIMKKGEPCTMKPVFSRFAQITVTGNERQGMRSGISYGCVCAWNPGVIRCNPALMI